MRWKGSMLLVHNAGITSKSFEGLDIMMTVIVTVFEAAGQTYRRRRRRRCCYEHDQTPTVPSLVVEAAGQRYRQMPQF